MGLTLSAILMRDKAVIYMLVILDYAIQIPVLKTFVDCTISTILDILILSSLFIRLHLLKSFSAK